VIAIATGTLVANLYYAQPLVTSIAPAIGDRPPIWPAPSSASAQIGYMASALFLLVSLADLIENRTLVLVTPRQSRSWAWSARRCPRPRRSSSPASFLVGLCSTGAQVLLPFVAHLVPRGTSRPRRRQCPWRAVLSGHHAGQARVSVHRREFRLARRVLEFGGAHAGYRASPWAKMMPRYQPRAGMHYGRILASMAGLLRDGPALRLAGPPIRR